MSRRSGAMQWTNNSSASAPEINDWVESIYNTRTVAMCGHGAWLTRTDGRARGYKQGWADGRAGSRASRLPKSVGSLRPFPHGG